MARLNFKLNDGLHAMMLESDGLHTGSHLGVHAIINNGPVQWHTFTLPATVTVAVALTVVA